MAVAVDWARTAVRDAALEPSATNSETGVPSEALADPT